MIDEFRIKPEDRRIIERKEAGGRWKYYGEYNTVDAAKAALVAMRGGGGLVLAEEEEESTDLVVAETFLYNYEGLDEETVTSLQSIVIDVRYRQQKAMANAIALGNHLRVAKALLGHGKFEKWAYEEFELSLGSIFEFRQIAERFGGNDEAIQYLTPTTARLLAPKVVPDEVIDDVIELSKSWGRPLLVREVKEVRRQVGVRLSSWSSSNPAIEADYTVDEEEEEEEEDDDHYAVVLEGDLWIRLRQATRKVQMAPFLSSDDIDKLAVAVSEALSDKPVPVAKLTVLPPPPTPPAPTVASFEEWLELMPSSDNPADLALLLEMMRVRLRMIRQHSPLWVPALNVLTHLEHLIEELNKRL